MQLWTRKESKIGNGFSTTRQQLAVIAFSLAAGSSYRASGYFFSEPFEIYFLAGLVALLLSCTILTKRSTSTKKYWQVPFAFFVFALAGLIDKVFTGGFIAFVLHQTPTMTNPLASTVQGTVLAQMVSTASIVLPVILLTKGYGLPMSSVFIDRTRIWNGTRIGIIGFAVFYLLTLAGLFQALFPNSGVSPSRFLALTPAVLILALSNGFREELWFRGLFLNKYSLFLSPLVSNLLQSTIFISFHLQVQYTAALVSFLGITFILSMWLGYMMKKTGNILGPAVFHAGADIPIFLGFLANASP